LFLSFYPYSGISRWQLPYFKMDFFASYDESRGGETLSK
jgi:hypothetical protein